MSVATSTAIGLGIAGAGIAGSAISGIVGSNAASNAASTQAAAANNAAALQKQEADDSLNFSKLQYGNSLNLLSPFYNTGVSANNQLAYLMGLNPAQGLPAGVTNPNVNSGAPAVSASGSPVINSPGITTSTNPSSRPGFAPVAEGATVSAPANALAARLNNTPQNATAGIQGGNITPTGTTDPANPGIVNPAITPGVNTDATSAGLPQFQPPTGITGTPVNGGTAQLPPGGFSGGGTSPTLTAGEAMAPVLPNGGGAAPVANAAATSTAPGGFGSLATGWNQTFNSPTTVDETNDPGYQFRMNQGTQALQNSAAARGGLLSGGTAKAETDFAQNDASNEYANVYNRALNNYNTNYNTFTNDQTNEFNRYAALSGQGQVSAQNLSTAGLATANQVGNTLLTAGQQIGNNINNAGAADASGYVGGANAINGAINGSINSLSLLSMLNKPNNNNAGGQGV